MPLLLKVDEGQTILKALERARIFSVSENGNMFEFTEECDCYFTRILDREQLLKLGIELIAMANNPPSERG